MFQNLRQLVMLRSKLQSGTACHFQHLNWTHKSRLKDGFRCNVVLIHTAWV